jgi:hypothetical protein
MVILRFDLMSEENVRLEVPQIMASDVVLLQGFERRNAGVRVRLWKVASYRGKPADLTRQST